MSWATSRKEGMAWYSSKPMPCPTPKAVLIIIDWLSHCHLNSWMISVPEFIDPVFAKTSPKRSFSSCFFCETGSINLGTGWVLAARVSCWLAAPTANKVMFLFVDQRQLLPQVLADLLVLSSSLFPVGWLSQMQTKLCSYLLTNVNCYHKYSLICWVLADHYFPVGWLSQMQTKLFSHCLTNVNC